MFYGPSDYGAKQCHS